VVALIKFKTKMLLINQLSKQTGIAIHTIRFYEKSGFYKGKKDANKKSNNYTYYGEEVVDKLALISEAKSVGFALSEVKELTDAWYGKRLTKAKKIEILNSKMKSIDSKIGKLKDVKKQIAAFIKELEEFDC